MGAKPYTPEERQWLEAASAKPNLTKKWIKENWPFEQRSTEGLYNYVNCFRRGLKTNPDVPPQQSVALEDYKEGEEEASWEATGLQHPVRTLDDLFEVSKVDRERWECSTWQAKAYQGYIKNAAGELETIQLHSVSARFKPKRGIDWRKEIAGIVQAARLPAFKVKALPLSTGSRRMIELAVPDLHAGKLAWGEESGEDYDTKIALKLHQRAVQTLIDSAKYWKPQECLYVIGNDLFNSDNSSNTTTRGTPQDVDTRHHKVFRMVRDEMIYTIKNVLATQFEKVHIVIVPGNHDNQTAWFLGEVLQAWFRESPTITVSNPAAHRKYHVFGKCLIGFAHGDNEKPQDLPTLMATERPEDYSRTLFREWHLGHIHRQRQIKFTDVWEERGCIIRYLSSLCASDAWHSSKGYSMQRRQAEALIWDADTGLVGTTVASLQALNTP